MALLEQQLDEFLQDGQQAGVMHCDAVLQHGQQVLDAVQLLVLRLERAGGIVEDFLNHGLLLLVLYKVQLLAQGSRIQLTFPASHPQVRSPGLWRSVIEPSHHYSSVMHIPVSGPSLLWQRPMYHMAMSSVRRLAVVRRLPEQLDPHTCPDTAPTSSQTIRHVRQHGMAKPPHWTHCLIPCLI